MATTVKPIPDGYATITPTLTVREAGKAIEFYGRAFGAEELLRMPGPGGKIVHAELRIGTSRIMLSEEAPQWGSLSPQALQGTPVRFYVYVENVDAAFGKAIAAGAREAMPVTDMFWGDRVGAVADPFGHVWTLATHKADLTREQIEEGQREWLAAMQAGPKK